MGGASEAQVRTHEGMTSLLNPLPRAATATTSHAGAGCYAVAQVSLLARRKADLQHQLQVVERNRRALVCAAAAHHVLQRHPNAAVLIFTVKDGRPTLLSQVLDEEGRSLPARRAGEWADSVLAQIIDEDPAELGGIDGVSFGSSLLRVDIESVLNVVIASRAAKRLSSLPEPLDHAAAA